MFMFKSLVSIFCVASFMFVLFNNYKAATFENRGNFVFVALYFSILFIMTVTYGCFRIGKQRVKELSFSFFIALFITNFFTYFIMSLIAERMLYVVPMLLLSLGQLVFAIMIFIVSNALYPILFPARDALYLCGADKCDYDAKVLNKLKHQPHRFDIKKVVDEGIEFDDIVNELSGLSTLVIGDVSPKLKAKLIDYCFANMVQLYISPSVSDIVKNSSQIAMVDDTLLLFARNLELSREQLFAKRALDVFVAVLGILLTSPLMLLTALAVWLYDRGPILYKQKRYTYNKQVFTLLKFRSMIVNAEPKGAQLAVNNDPRITPIGRIIRALRFDELPQLFNILKGEMTLVGPRAERIENTDEYTKWMPEFAYRLKVKAGLTGYAQVYGKYNTSHEDKARMDIYYIVNYSLLLDLKIIFYTIKILFIKDSTDGFAEEKIEKHKKQSVEPQ